MSVGGQVPIEKFGNVPENISVYESADKIMSVCKIFVDNNTYSD